MRSSEVRLTTSFFEVMQEIAAEDGRFILIHHPRRGWAYTMSEAAEYDDLWWSTPLDRLIFRIAQDEDKGCLISSNDPTLLVFANPSMDKVTTWECVKDRNGLRWNRVAVETPMEDPAEVDSPVAR